MQMPSVGIPCAPYSSSSASVLEFAKVCSGHLALERQKDLVNNDTAPGDWKTRDGRECANGQTMLGKACSISIPAMESQKP